MILPTKHVRLEDSLIGIGAELLPMLDGSPSTMTTLWESYRSLREQTKRPIPYANFVLALDLLHIVGLVDLDRENRLVTAHGTH